jgi:hypothetical protein
MINTTKNTKDYETDFFKLLSSGMFWEFYPDLSGNWSVDKDQFIKNEKLLDNTSRKKYIQSQFRLKKQQPTPKGTGKDIISLVHDDLESRAKKGEETYGERLRSFNGRDSIVDAYEEALDLVIYLRQFLEENN